MTDRAREGLFASLGDRVAGEAVLDLFAGTGAVGIEALSRGAAHAVFVDSGAKAVRTIRENLRRCGLQDRGTVLRRDVRRALSAGVRAPGGGAFGLAFVDPPYPMAEQALGAALAALAASGALRDGAYVVISRSTRTSMPVIPLDWAPDRTLQYGDAIILVYRTAPQGPQEDRRWASRPCAQGPSIP
jgi:16S rRNA (guanine966-N2)-methyltransferase